MRKMTDLISNLNQTDGEKGKAPTMDHAGACSTVPCSQGIAKLGQSPSVLLRLFTSLRLAFFAGLVVVLLGGCSRTPQIGGDRECLAAADALWTAVTARQSGLLESSAAEIEQLHAEAKLPDDAFAALGAIIASARAERWPEARVALKTFVRGQRRAAGH